MGKKSALGTSSVPFVVKPKPFGVDPDEAAQDLAKGVRRTTLITLVDVREETGEAEVTEYLVVVDTLGGKRVYRELPRPRIV